MVFFNKTEAGGFIGRKGENINELTSIAGCSIQVDRDEPADRDMCAIRIEANDPRQFDDTVRLLIDCAKLTFLKSASGKVLKDTSAAGRAGFGSDPREQAMEELWVPDRLVGLCIGAGGSTILAIERATNTKLNVHKFCPPGKYERCIEVCGAPAGVAEAKGRIMATIDEVQAKPVRIVKDDYDFQDPAMLAIIRKIVDYDEL